MKSTKQEYIDLRNRLNPVVKDEYVQPQNLKEQAKIRKEKLDDMAHLRELELIENDYINGYD